MRILLADDHEIVRRGVRSLLSLQSDWEICGEAIDGQDAVVKAEGLRPNVIVMDISMPNLNGIEAARQVRRQFPQIEVLMLSQHDSPEMMRQAMKVGARGYVVKSAIATDLIAALRKIETGASFFEKSAFRKEDSPADAQEILQRTAAYEVALRESEERFRLTFEHAAVGMAHVAEDGRWLLVNEKLCKIVGYTQDELRKLTYQDITHPADLASDMSLAGQLASGKLDNYSMEKRYIRKDGSSVWVNLTAAALRDANGKLKYFVSAVEDISARKTAEERLVQTQQELQIIAAHREAEAEALAKLNEWNAGLLRTDSLEEGLSAMLDAVIDLLGAEKGNVQVLDPKTGTLRILVHRGFNQDFLDYFRAVTVNDQSVCGRALRTGERIVVEDVETDEASKPLLAIARASGYRAVISAPMIGIEGRPLGMVSVHFRTAHRPSMDSLRRLDLYAKQAASFIHRCRAEEALRESEGRFRAIVNTTPDCVKLVAHDGTLLHMNASGLNMLGASSLEQVVGKNVYDVVAPEDRARYREFNENICRGEKGSIEFDLIGLQGQRRHMESHAAPLLNPDGTHIHLAVTLDCTAHKRAEEAQYRLAAIVDSSDDAIVSKDLNGVITSWNAGAERIFGFTSDEALGQSINLIIPPELRREEQSILRRLRNGERIERLETVRMKKDGSRINVSLTISPVRDAQGRIIGASTIARDITQEKKAEEALDEKAFAELTAKHAAATRAH